MVALLVTIAVEDKNRREEVERGGRAGRGRSDERRLIDAPYFDRREEDRRRQARREIERNMETSIRHQEDMSRMEMREEERRRTMVRKQPCCDEELVAWRRSERGRQNSTGMLTNGTSRGGRGEGRKEGATQHKRRVEEEAGVRGWEPQAGRREARQEAFNEHGTESMTATQLHAGRYVHDEDQRRRGEEETDARDRRGRGGTEGHGPQGREASQGSDLSISGDEVGGASFEVSPRSFIDLEAFANVGEQPLPSDAARVSKEEADAARAVGELKVSADKIIAFLLNENRSLSQQLVASQQHNQRLSVEREEAARALGSMSDKFGRSLRALEETLACLNNAFDFVDLERIGEYKETCGIVEHKSVQVDMLTEARGSASSRKEAVVLSPRYQDVDMILDKTRSFLEDFDKRTSELRSASSSPAKKVKKVKHQHAGEDWLERSFGSEGFMRESDIYPSFDSADHQSLPKRYTTNEMLIFRRFLKAKKDLMLHGWE